MLQPHRLKMAHTVWANAQISAPARHGMRAPPLSSQRWHDVPRIATSLRSLQRRHRQKSGTSFAKCAWRPVTTLASFWTRGLLKVTGANGAVQQSLYLRDGNFGRFPTSKWAENQMTSGSDVGMSSVTWGMNSDVTVCARQKLILSQVGTWNSLFILCKAKPKRQSRRAQNETIQRTSKHLRPCSRTSAVFPGLWSTCGEVGSTGTQRNEATPWKRTDWRFSRRKSLPSRWTITLLERGAIARE